MPQTCKESVRTHRVDDCFHIKSARSQKRNSLDGLTILALAAAVEAAENARARPVVPSGECEDFCAGTDLSPCLGAADTLSSYGNIDKILKAACDSGADAIHPGYGFLSENAEFADRRSGKDDIVFVEPPVEALRITGSKLHPRKTALKIRTIQLSSGRNFFFLEPLSLLLLHQADSRKTFPSSCSCGRILPTSMNSPLCPLP